MGLVFACLVFSGLSASSPARADDLDRAPPPLTLPDGRKAVPIDITDAELKIVFSSSSRVSARKAEAQATIKFRVKEAGLPMFRFALTRQFWGSLDGDFNVPRFEYDTPAETRLLEPKPELPAPEHRTRVWVYARALDPAAEHTLVLHYSVASRTTFHDRGVAFAFFMNDLDHADAPAGFLDRYMPANFEFDAFPLRVELEVQGEIGPHRLFANGEASEAGAGKWRIAYPAYFTSSSHFLHLTDRELEVAREEYAGKEAAIPITAYAEERAVIDEALPKVRQVLAELEEAYGAFPHRSLTLYLTRESLGPGVVGMEYAGAAMTDTGAVAHELFHSWFARGVMPQDGDSGWMDEAIATWRDVGYVHYLRSLRKRAQLAGFSPYRVDTPSDAYGPGLDLLNCLDRKLQPKGGLRPALRDWFAERKLKVASTADFEAFLEKRFELSLAEHFQAYVYGRAVEGRPGGIPVEPCGPDPDDDGGDGDGALADGAGARRLRGPRAIEIDAAERMLAPAPGASLRPSHPRRYTEKELARLR